MGTYKMSNGERISKEKINIKTKEAKALKLHRQKYEHGYNFCEKTHASRMQYIDCSHIISVKECQESGRSELAWDLDNIEILCRSEHIKIEMMPKEERELLYLEKKNKK